MTSGPIRRGDVWLVDFGDPTSPESGYRRPALVVSSDRMHRGRLAVVCPMTTTARDYPWRVEVEADTGNGLTATSWVQSEHVRAISTDRLQHRQGSVDPVVMASVSRVLGLLLDL